MIKAEIEMIWMETIPLFHEWKRQWNEIDKNGGVRGSVVQVGIDEFFAIHNGGQLTYLNHSDSLEQAKKEYIEIIEKEEQRDD